MTDELDDFVEFDATIGPNVVTCKKCGKDISSSSLLDDEIECPSCGNIFSKNDG